MISSLASEIGSQSVAVTIDVITKRSLLGERYLVSSHNGQKIYEIDLFGLLSKCQDLGAGEIIINSVTDDGNMSGYNLTLAEKVKNQLQVPFTLLGGAGNLDDLKNLIKRCGPIGACAGSLFVFKGRYRAVLINYPQHEEKIAMSKIWPEL